MERLIGGDACPARAGVIGAEEAAECRSSGCAASGTTAASTGGRRGRSRGLRIRQQTIHHGIQALGIARCDRDPRAADPFGGEALGHRLPGGATIHRLPHPATRAVRRRVGVPGWATRIPESGVDDLGVGGIDRDIHRADVVVLEEHACPRLAAVDRAEEAAIVARRVERADGGDEGDVRILGIDRDAPDVLRAVEPAMRPRLAGVGGLVHPVPESHGIAQRRFTAADIERVGRRGRHGDRADRGHGLSVEHRGPDASGVNRLPDAAIHRAEVELVRASRHPGHRRGSATAEGAEHAPAKARVGAVRLLAAGAKQKRIVRAVAGGLCVQQSAAKERIEHRNRDSESSGEREKVTTVLRHMSLNG